MRRAVGLSFALALLTTSALGQTAAPVQTLPGLGTSANGNASGTIAVTGTFQKVWGAAAVATPRRGCTIQNNSSTHTMWIEEGATAATAAEASAQQLAAGGIFNCTTGGIALQGEIDITGTAADAFYAIQY